MLEGRLPSMADLPRLPFVERVVTEVHAPVPAGVDHRPPRDRRLSSRGLRCCRARSLIFMSPYIMQRDARFYAEPDRFDPDRWTPEFKAALPPFAYFPFGGGARKCIGDQFALMEIALVLATVAQQWKLQLVPGHPVVAQPLITLRAKHGMMMTATSKNSRATALNPAAPWPTTPDACEPRAKSNAADSAIVSRMRRLRVLAPIALCVSPATGRRNPRAAERSRACVGRADRPHLSGERISGAAVRAGTLAARTARPTPSWSDPRTERTCRTSSDTTPRPVHARS